MRLSWPPIAPRTLMLLADVVHLGHSVSLASENALAHTLPHLVVARFLDFVSTLPFDLVSANSTALV